MKILSVKNLCKRYEKFELKNVSFELEEGYIMGFIGRNGAGKSTTIKSMLNLVHPDGGEVTVCGRDFYENELECKQQIGLVLGNADYYKRSKLKNVADVVSRIYREWDEETYRTYLKRFELDDGKRIGELSSGMSVKFALALALSHNARLLVLDEPTSGLDPVSRNDLLDVFRSIIEDGTRSILFSTHITSDLEKCADFITYIKDGEIVASKPMDEFTGSYTIVKGANELLTPEFERKLTGLKKNSFGFSGLAFTSELPEGAFDYSPVDLEDIMIYNERDESKE